MKHNLLELRSLVIFTLLAILGLHFATATAGRGIYFGAIPYDDSSDAPGVSIGKVIPGSPAETAGLKTGDLIVKVGAKAILTSDDLLIELQSQPPGQEIEVFFQRNGAIHKTRVRLAPTW